MSAFRKTKSKIWSIFQGSSPSGHNKVEDALALPLHCEGGPGHAPRSLSSLLERLSTGGFPAGICGPVGAALKHKTRVPVSGSGLVTDHHLVSFLVLLEKYSIILLTWRILY